MWPAILRPGKTLAGVAEEPMEPRCLLDLDPWVMAPLLMFHLLMVPAYKRTPLALHWDHRGKRHCELYLGRFVSAACNPPYLQEISLYALEHFEREAKESNTLARYAWTRGWAHVNHQLLHCHRVGRACCVMRAVDTLEAFAYALSCHIYLVSHLENFVHLQLLTRAVISSLLELHHQTCIEKAFPKHWHCHSLNCQLQDQEVSASWMQVSLPRHSRLAGNNSSPTGERITKFCWLHTAFSTKCPNLQSHAGPLSSVCRLLHHHHKC